MLIEGTSAIRVSEIHSTSGLYGKQTKNSCKSSICFCKEEILRCIINKLLNLLCTILFNEHHTKDRIECYWELLKIINYIIKFRFVEASWANCLTHKRISISTCGCQCINSMQLRNKIR